MSTSSLKDKAESYEVICINGGLGLVQKMVILKYLASKSFLADIPLGVQKVLMIVIAPVGRMMGSRAIYKKYSGLVK